MSRIMRLSDLGRIVTGNTPKTSDFRNYNSKDICFVKPSDIPVDCIGRLRESEFYISEFARDKARMLPKGSVLLTCIGIIGKVAVNEIECAFNQQINAIIPDCDKCDCIYLAYALSAKKDYLQALANAPVVPIINKTQFSAFQIPVPSLSVQSDIVKRIEIIDYLISLRQRQAEKLDELAKARFVEMFGDPVLNCQGFPVRTIGELTTEVKYGTSKPAVEGGKYPYLRMNNLTIDGKLDLHDLKQIDVDTSEFEKCVVRKGDVLFNRTNSAELVGKTAYYGLDEEMIIAGYIIRVRVNNLILPQYLSFYMNMPFMKQRIRSMAKGAVNQANINSKELKSIKVIVPPLEVQGKVVEYEERIDREKDRIQRSAALLETLKRSLMQQYFG